jgi:hypothetical protein
MLVTQINIPSQFSQQNWTFLFCAMCFDVGGILSSSLSTACHSGGSFRSLHVARGNLHPGFRSDDWRALLLGLFVTDTSVI